MTAESTFSDPYEAVLADLRAKRAQLDQAIAAIEAIRAGQPIPGARTTWKTLAALSRRRGPKSSLGFAIANIAIKYWVFRCHKKP
jgi:hypothetical protein